MPAGVLRRAIARSRSAWFEGAPTESSDALHACDHMCVISDGGQAPCILYHVFSTLYPVCCSVHAIHCTASVPSVSHTVPCALNAHFTLRHCALYPVCYIVCCALYVTLCAVSPMLHCVLYPVCYVLRPHVTYHTLHVTDCALYVTCSE